jgi:hypothetical protein
MRHLSASAVCFLSSGAQRKRAGDPLTLAAENPDVLMNAHKKRPFLHEV